MERIRKLVTELVRTTRGFEFRDLSFQQGAELNKHKVRQKLESRARRQIKFAEESTGRGMGEQSHVVFRTQKDSHRSVPISVEC